MRGTTFCSAAVLLLLTAGLAGCRHKVQTLQVPQAQAPSLNTSTITVITPLPSVPATAKPSVEPASAPKPAPEAPPKEKEKHRHRRHKENREKHPATEAPAEIKPQPETEPVSPAVNAAQWSTGMALNPRQRAQMFSAIQLQQHRISDVKNAQASDRQTILVQIRLFLEKARVSVANNDLDGAMTLTTKARVLLDELQGVEP
jgi:outer membrane biosynthesis protein TonB